MKRRHFLRNMTATAAIPALAQAGGKVTNIGKPNMLWIYSDDHSHNAVSAYGGLLAKVAPTPNIDRLAKEGMLFRNSFVTNSICGPCRAVIMTGKHSHLNGFRKNGDNFDGTQQTFPRLLKQSSDYQTAVIGKWHLKSNPNGFDHWEVLPGQGHYYNPDFLVPDPGTKKGNKMVHHEGYVTDIITDKGLDWLQNQRDPDKPFMLMLQHKAPHREWCPASRHLTLYDDVTFPEPPNLFDTYENRGNAAKLQDMSIEKTMDEADLKLWTETPPADKKSRDYKRWKGLYMRMTDAQRKKWNAAYFPKNDAMRAANLKGKDLVRWKYQRYIKDYMRCIAAVDENVGRVLDYLDQSGLAKNTVVFYSADQSFYLGEHGWFDKRFIYEESLRTPLLARWPGVITPGATTEALVQNLDMAETFLDLAGEPVPADMQGASLVPVMIDRTPKNWRKSIYYHYYEGEGKVHNVYKHYGLRTDRFKLAFFYTLDEWEFYDLKKDPLEMKSEIGNPEYAQKITELKKELQRLRGLYQVDEDPDVKK